MLKHHLKIALRNFLRNKSYTIINIGGLCLGIACALVVFQIVRFEYSFDSHHDDRDRIYRVVRMGDEFGTIRYMSAMSYPLPAALHSDFPEIENLTIVDGMIGSPVVTVRIEGELRRFREVDGIAFVQPDYFKIFKYQWLQGSPETALSSPDRVVISKSLADKYFGGKDPLGETLTFDSKELQVSGIVNDVPPNTDLPFNMLIAFDAAERVDPNWGDTYGPVNCYLKLQEGTDPQELESRFHDFLRKYRDKESADKITLMLQPLSELHFDTRFGSYNRTISRTTLGSLALIAAALVLMACINFINLSTAHALNRLMEVGIRKVLGSSRAKIVWQLVGETALISFLAVLVSLAVAEIAVKKLENLVDFVPGLDFFSDPAILVFLVILFILVSIGAGLYPALYSSRFTPIATLRKNRSTLRMGGYSLRRGLVVLQFAISQTLIVSTLVISNQTDFLSNVDMGFNKDAVVEVRLPSAEDAKLERFKSELLRQTGIRSIGFSNTGTASRDDWGGDYVLKNGDQMVEEHAQIKFVDSDFFSTYEVSLLAGRLPTGSESSSFLVNEAFARESGYGQRYADLLGKYVTIWKREAPISGVVRDFHTQSLHREIEPVVIVFENVYQQAGIKISMNDPTAEIGAIGKIWSSIYPENVFDYAFLDDSIAEFYHKEQRTANLINTFTTIAIIIGCLGLYGLVSYISTRRTKEIGIRKVLGATAVGILNLLTKDMIRPVLVANLIAWPVSWWILNNWLQGFAYHIDLGWMMFALGGGLALILTILTVGSQAIRAAVTNPVESLRYE